MIVDCFRLPRTNFNCPLQTKHPSDDVKIHNSQAMNGMPLADIQPNAGDVPNVKDGKTPNVDELTRLWGVSGRKSYSVADIGKAMAQPEDPPIGQPSVFFFVNPI